MKPILFNTDMVRAILDGRKTVTRRVVKPQHLRVLDSSYHKEHPETPDKVLLERLCEPPYCPGDILYVRETWSPVHIHPKRYLYKADADACKGEGAGLPIKWHPSIHMPREAARIFLRVTDVRVERLQDITEEQAIAEGFEAIICPHPCGCPCTDCIDTGYLEPAMLGFVETWNSTIKPADRPRYGWEANPWCWVIEFERVNKEEAIQ